MQTGRKVIIVCKRMILPNLMESNKNFGKRERTIPQWERARPEVERTGHYLEGIVR